jgi:hypothetical protein
MKFAKLQEFRQEVYKHLGKAHDATFELTDAILLEFRLSNTKRPSSAELMKHKLQR